MKDLFPRRLSLPVHHDVLFPGFGLHVGLEVVRPETPYRWDGLRRGGQARAPYGLFQYTLEGHGIFERGRTVETVPSGHAFLARIPSRHVYRSDPACVEWKFFWIIFEHPYVVARLFAHRNLLNRVLALPPDSAPLRAAATLAEKVWRRGRDDAPAYEEALFVWMLELERWAFAQRHPSAPRRQLFDHVRREVLADLAAPLPIARLAASLGMTRSNFTHHFARTTGQTPAAFIREIRLAESVRLLRENEHSIKEIAAATGFANANHFCKAFRARFHVSPGTYRHRRHLV